jgi:hypothetical protein
MKKIFSLFIITLLVFTSVSCKKEDPIRPENNNVSTVEGDGTIFDINWVISDAKFYTEDLGSGDKTYYDHFSSTQNLSVLNPFSGVDIPFDTIINGYTTWYISSSTFTLNGSKSYDYTGDGVNNVSVIGLENGSSRPIEILYVSSESLTVKVHEGYGSYSGNNYEFFSIVTFIKQGVQCSTCDYDVLYGYSYGTMVSLTHTLMTQYLLVHLLTISMTMVLTANTHFQMCSVIT